MTFEIYPEYTSNWNNMFSQNVFQLCPQASEQEIAATLSGGPKSGQVGIVENEFHYPCIYLSIFFGTVFKLSG